VATAIQTQAYKHYRKKELHRDDGKTESENLYLYMFSHDDILAYRNSTGAFD